MIALELNIFENNFTNFTGNVNIVTNICRIQPYSSIIYGYFCIGCIDFMLKDKRFQEYTKLFSLNVYEANDNMILKYF